MGKAGFRLNLPSSNPEHISLDTSNHLHLSRSHGPLKREVTGLRRRSGRAWPHTYMSLLSSLRPTPLAQYLVSAGQKALSSPELLDKLTNLPCMYSSPGVWDALTFHLSFHSQIYLDILDCSCLNCKPTMADFSHGTRVSHTLPRGIPEALTSDCPGSVLAVKCATLAKSLTPLESLRLH